MNNRQIYKLFDSLASSVLSAEKKLELTLQLTLWAKLSSNNKIENENSIDNLRLRNKDEIQSVFQKLRAKGRLMHEAFNDLSALRAIDSIHLAALIDDLMRMKSDGTLENIDIKNIAEPRREFNFLRDRRDGLYAMPNEVASLLVDLANINSGDTVYVPWDSIFAQISTRAAQSSNEVYFESMFYSAIPALLSLLTEKRFAVEYSDPILKPTAVQAGCLKKYKKCISFPPFGMQYRLDQLGLDLFGRFPDSAKSSSILTIRHALSQTNGKVIIAIPNSVLFGLGFEKRLRKELVLAGNIESIISLPSGLLHSTGVSFSILIMNTEGGRRSINFINADSEYFFESSGREMQGTLTRRRLRNTNKILEAVKSSKNSEFSIVIDIDQVIANDFQLQVERYLLPKDLQSLSERLSQYKRIRLESIVDFIRPFTFFGQEEPFISAIEIGVAEIPQFGFIRPGGNIVQIGQSQARRSEYQFLRAFDIVLIVKGKVGAIGIVPEEVPSPGEGGWVPGQSGIVLRCNSKQQACALFMQLRSPLGRDLLNSIVSGASIKLIQLRELRNLYVIQFSDSQTREANSLLEQEEHMQMQIDVIKQNQAQVAKNFLV
jgi:type I restriction enzyme M protein